MKIPFNMCLCLLQVYQEYYGTVLLHGLRDIHKKVNLNLFGLLRHHNMQGGLRRRLFAILLLTRLPWSIMAKGWHCQHFQKVRHCRNKQHVRIDTNSTLSSQWKPRNNQILIFVRTNDRSRCWGCNYNDLRSELKELTMKSSWWSNVIDYLWLELRAELSWFQSCIFPRCMWHLDTLEVSFCILYLLSIQFPTYWRHIYVHSSTTPHSH
jgi:hypothetical protein